MAELRLGVSMRVAEGPHAEFRDCLAQDWPRWLASALPEVLWLPVPNLGRAAARDYVDRWGLNGFLLTGGNDLGERPERDETERALLDLALERTQPLVGVCRGLQLINVALGGALSTCSREEHAGTQHPVLLEAGLPGLEAPLTCEVNSYHGFAVSPEQLAPKLRPVGKTPDGAWIEAVRHRDAPITAIQWHPEREGPSHDLDRRVVRAALGLS